MQKHFTVALDLLIEMKIEGLLESRHLNFTYEKSGD